MVCQTGLPYVLLSSRSHVYNGHRGTCNTIDKIGELRKGAETVSEEQLPVALCSNRVVSQIVMEDWSSSMGQFDVRLRIDQRTVRLPAVTKTLVLNHKAMLHARKPMIH